jgi:hypothetical protein
MCDWQPNYHTGGIFFYIAGTIVPATKKIVPRSKKMFHKKLSKCDLVLKISSQGTQWCSRILIWIYSFEKYDYVTL